MSVHELTIETYNRSARKLAEYFRSMGPRVKDIELALELAGNPPEARVVEIGCGAGRDAAEIVKRVRHYLGFDPSTKMIELARQAAPEADFQLANSLTFGFPPDLDVVYAFASLLHIDKADLSIVLQKLGRAVRPGGIVLVSLKEKNEYSAELRQDDFGQRIFYYYTVELVTELAEDFEAVYEDHQTIGSTNWFTLALRRK